MRVPQREIGKGVIKRFAIELDDVGISSLVIGVTMVAVLLRSIRLTPMKSLTRQPVRRNFLVTCKASSRLRFSRERFVAIAAILLKFGVPVDDRPRENKLFKQVL